MKKSITASSYFPYYGQKRGLERLSSDGYDAIDVGLSDYKHPIYLLSEEEALEWAADLLKAVKAAGLTVCQTHGPWRWPPRDAAMEDRQEVLDHNRRALLVTKALECPYMVIHPLMPFGDSRDPDPLTTGALNKDFFKTLMPMAQAAGVIVCLENVPMPALSLASVESINRFVKDMDHPNLMACLDTGHALVTGEEPAEAARLLGPRLKCLHIHDNHAERDEHLWPGDGAADWDAFRRSLSEIGYQGVLSLETGVLEQNLTEEKRIEQEKELFRRLEWLTF